MALNLKELKTINKKKNKVIAKPAQIPLIIERQYHSDIRAFNTRFKEVVRQTIFPLIETLSTLTRDSLTTDGIGEDIDRAIEELKRLFTFSTAARAIASNMVNGVARVNEKKTQATLSNAIGVDLGEIIKSENLSEFIEIQSVNNGKLISNVPEDALNDIRRIVLNGLAEGKRHEEIKKLISGSSVNSVFNKMNNRIKTIARNETAKINGQITRKRLKALGVKRGVWDAVNDDRTRKCHKAREGKEFDLDKGLYSSCDGKTLQTGEEINCRCVTRALIE